MADLSIRKPLQGGISPIIASYDYYDIAEGTGIKEFLGFTYANAEISGSSGALLSSNINFTKTNSTSSLMVSGAGLQKGVEVSFALTQFNFPKEIQGTGLFRGSWTIAKNGVDTSSGAMVVKIKKFDGITEQTISSVSGATIIAPAGTYQECFKFNIPKTHFKVGEQLLVNAELWGTTKTAVSTNITMSINHNPATTDASGAFKIQIPFRLNQ